MMESYGTNNTTRTVVAFLGGVAIGYGMALLFAPRSGRETRAMLGDYAQQTGEAISSFTRTAADSAKEASQRMGQRVGEYVERGREKIKGAQQGAAAAASSAGKTLEEQAGRIEHGS